MMIKQQDTITEKVCGCVPLSQKSVLKTMIQHPVLNLRASPEHAKATGFWFLKMGLHADPFQSLSCHPTRNERVKRRTGVIKKRKDVHGADG